MNECYSFSFDYVNAIGNSGGVLALGAFVMTSHAGLVAAMLKLIKRTIVVPNYILFNGHLMYVHVTRYHHAFLAFFPNVLHNFRH